MLRRRISSTGLYNRGTSTARDGERDGIRLGLGGAARAARSRPGRVEATARPGLHGLPRLTDEKFLNFVEQFVQEQPGVPAVAGSRLWEMNMFAEFSVCVCVCVCVTPCI